MLSELKNITRKQSPIYYRRLYSAESELSFAGNTQMVIFDFLIETTALGTNKTSITVKNDVDYPMLNLVNELKAKIEDFDKRGLLPL